MCNISTARVQSGVAGLSIHPLDAACMHACMAQATLSQVSEPFKHIRHRLRVRIVIGVTTVSSSPQAFIIKHSPGNPACTFNVLLLCMPPAYVSIHSRNNITPTPVRQICGTQNPIPNHCCQKVGDISSPSCAHDRFFPFHFVSAWRSAFVPRIEGQANSPTPCFKIHVPKRDPDTSNEKIIPTVGSVGPGVYRIVICLAMEALLEEPEAPIPAEAPAFFSKIFQNFKLSSAAIIMLALVF